MDDSGTLAPGILRERVVWITGGGTGLGFAMAGRFARLGATVALSGRREDVIARAAEAIRDGGGRACSVPCDVRRPESVKRALDAVTEAVGLPDTLVNNAAGNFLCPTEELSPNAFSSVVAIVLHGTFHCTTEIGRRWIARGSGGTVLNIATTYAETGSAFVVPSACAKAGVVALTRSLAVEWGRHRIRVNAIAPGPIPTEGAFSRLLPSSELEAARRDRVPAGRLGTPEELAELAAFLISEASDWMRGEVVTFDGGEWLRGAGEFNDLLDAGPEVWDSLRRLKKKIKENPS